MIFRKTQANQTIQVTRTLLSILADFNNAVVWMVLYRTLEWWLDCSSMTQEAWVQSQVESYKRLKKWYLMPPCLTLSIIRCGSRVKWSKPGKRLAPSLTPWCKSYRKGSLRVTLDNSRQLTFEWSLLYNYGMIFLYKPFFVNYILSFSLVGL